MSNREISGHMQWGDGKAVETGRVSITLRPGTRREKTYSAQISRGKFIVKVPALVSVRANTSVSIAVSSGRRRLSLIENARRVSDVDGNRLTAYAENLQGTVKLAEGMPLDDGEIELYLRRAPKKTLSRARINRQGQFMLSLGGIAVARKKFGVRVVKEGRSLPLDGTPGWSTAPPRELSLRLKKSLKICKFRIEQADQTPVKSGRLSVLDSRDHLLGQGDVKNGRAEFLVDHTGKRNTSPLAFQLSGLEPEDEIKPAKIAVKELGRTTIIVHRDVDKEFMRLNTKVPLLLMPVRIETRFFDIGTANAELRVRIFPDDIQVSAHRYALSQHEKDLARIFRTEAGEDADQATEAFAWLARQVGLPRALYIAEKNRFGEKAPNITCARLLPARWHLIGRLKDKEEFAKSGEYIPEDVRENLPVVPGIDDLDGTETLDELISAQGLDWIKDFETAETLGMGIRISLDAKQIKRIKKDGLDLTVVGVHTDNAATGARALARLLKEHRVDKGLDLVVPDTPTNNTSDTSAMTIPGSRTWWRATQNVSEEAATSGTDISALLGTPDAKETMSKTPGASYRHDALSRTVQEVIWPASIGYVVKNLLGNLIDDQTVSDALANWFFDYVRADGPVLSLRVGDQPYGILPIARRGQVFAPEDLPRLPEILNTLRRDHWEKSTPKHVGLSEDDSDHLQEVLDILAAEPGAGDMSQRAVHSDKARHKAAEVLMRILTMMTEEGRARYSALWDDLDQAPNGDAQLALARMADVDWFGRAYEAHAERTSLARELAPDEVNGRFYEDDDPLAFHFRYEDDVEILEDVSDDPALLDQLEALARGEPSETDAPKNWLFRLVSAACSRGDESTRQAVIDLVMTARNHEDAIPWLERLIRRHLGLAGHRLDAWITAMATARLMAMRQEQATGLTIGSFGLVRGLKPRKTQSPVSQSVIFAPSQDSASTGAILYNGMKSFGGGEDYSLATVNLRSDRVRRANWILDALRNGRSLPEILGLRIERDLIQAGLGGALPVLREAVNGIHGSIVPIDGERLAKAYENPPNGTQASALRAKVETALDENVPHLRLGTEKLITALADDFDAVSDLLLAEGIHTITQGREDNASAWLSSQRSGESPPPEISLMRAPPAEKIENHRLIVLCPEASGSENGWAFDAMAKKHPHIEGWTRLVIGPAHIFSRGTGTGSLSGLGISALSAMLEATQEGADGRSLLQTRIENADGSADGGDQAELSFEDFGAVAATLLDLLGNASPLGKTGLNAAANRKVEEGSVRSLVQDVGSKSLKPFNLDESTRARLGDEPETNAIEALGKLYELATIRPNVAMTMRLLDFSEGLIGDAAWRLDVIHGGAHGRDIWSVLRPRRAPGAKAAGFVVDTWTERLPSERTTAGAAIHFDGPQSRAPQALLLALSEESWTRDSVVEIVDEALALAKLRSIGLDQVMGVGQFLPAVFLPEDDI